MIDINKDPKEIIEELSETEKNILYVLGKMRISVKKNFDEKSLKKKLSNQDLKNYKKAFSNLFTSGIIVMYRPDNYGVSKQGWRVTDEILNQKRKNMYSGLRILMLQL